MSKTQTEVLAEVLKIVNEARTAAGDLAIMCVSQNLELSELEHANRQIGRFKGVQEIYNYLCHHLTETEEDVKEQAKGDVVLEKIGSRKIDVIKVVRSITGWGLKETKDLVEQTPVRIRRFVSYEEAETIMKRLAEVGATSVSSHSLMPTLREFEMAEK